MHTVPFTQIQSTVYAIIGTLETLRAVRDTPTEQRKKTKRRRETTRANKHTVTHMNQFSQILDAILFNFHLNNMNPIKIIRKNFRLNTSHRPFMVRFQRAKC